VFRNRLRNPPIVVGHSAAAHPVAVVEQLEAHVFRVAQLVESDRVENPHLVFCP
jgi:hypothetical protein